VIGVGNTGCAVVDILKNEDGYEVYKIEAKIRGNRTLSFPVLKTIQEYETEALEKEEKIEGLFEDVSEEDTVTVIVSGADVVSGSTLVVLEKLRKKTKVLDVLYIRPDRSFLTKEKKDNDAFVFGVLQEFARSGVLEKIYLIDVAQAEKIMGEVPLAEYEKRLHELIASTMTLVKFYTRTEPILDNRGEPKETSRIATFGVSSFENNILEEVFFDLKSPQEKIYFYGMSKDDLESDGSLLKKIKSHAKSMEKEDSGHEVSFAVFQTSYEENMVLCLLLTDKVQV